MEQSICEDVYGEELFQKTQYFISETNNRKAG
jgi:hypothetical protein